MRTGVHYEQFLQVSWAYLRFLYYFREAVLVITFTLL